jgi:transcriptional regulator with XRE-family HTH domain
MLELNQIKGGPMTNLITHAEVIAVGKRIKEIQRIKKLTNSDMAEIMGISHVQYEKLLRGVSMFTEDKFLTLHKELGVSVDYLLTGDAPNAGDKRMTELEYVMCLERLERYLEKLPRDERIEKMNEMFTTFHDVFDKL